jgi:hypothetical protein
MKLPLAIFLPLFCCHCTPMLSGTAEGIDPNPFMLLEKQATAANRDASRIVIPILRAPDLEKRWGKPKLFVGPKGGYALRYQNPKSGTEHMTLFGSPEKFRKAGPIPPPYTDVGHDEKKMTFTPMEISQTWQSTRIVGKTVRFYISQGKSGGDPLQYSTETLPLTAPDGRTASYRIRVSSDRSDITPLLQTARFD